MTSPSAEVRKFVAPECIIGPGDTSIRKSYYPEHQRRIHEMEKKNEELRRQFEETVARDKELRENEERFRRLGDITDTGYLVLDNRGRSGFPS